VTIQDGDLLRLFIYSLAWRGEIVKINNFEMQADNQESLRVILHKCLSLDPTELLKNISENNVLIKSIPIIVTISEVKGKNDNYIYCSLSYKPYAMILNDFSFQLFFDDAPDNGFDPQFMGINEVIEKDKLLMKGEAEFKIGVLSDDLRRRINGNLTNTMKDIILKRAIEDFSTGMRTFFQREPIKKEIELFIQNVIKRGEHKIENYTPRDFAEAASETMMQLFPGKFKS